jgi:hypothetical protein
VQPTIPPITAILVTMAPTIIIGLILGFDLIHLLKVHNYWKKKVPNFEKAGLFVACALLYHIIFKIKI